MNAADLIVRAVLVCTLAAPLHAQTVSYDPYEGYNRVMFDINDRLDRNLIAPVARGYRAVTPPPVRSGIGNFFNNLRDMASVAHNLLRLDITKAGSDLVRVGINTTFGFGGLIDIAGAAQMPDNKTTLGDTLASWGWENSNYFVYPVLGPSTVRDAVGTTVSQIYPIERALAGNGNGTAVWTAAGIKAVHTRASVLELTDGVEAAAIDRYAYVRDAYMAARARQLGQEWPDGGDYVPSFEETGAEQTPDEQGAAAEETVLRDASVGQTEADTATVIAPLPHPRDLPPHTLHIEILPAVGG